MNPEIEGHLRKARRKITAGQIMLEKGDPEEAASDAYYAMYHAAKAMLLPRASKVTRHEEVKRKFGDLLVGTGKIEARFRDYLEAAYHARVFADYATDARFTISADDARLYLKNAAEFVDVAEQFLKGAGGKVEQ
jgi:uncharacterized protein